MVKTKSGQFYVSILSQIKQALETAVNNHRDAFPQLKEIIETFEKEHIDIDEMCRFSDKKAYYHNKYIVGAMYLCLGECYDFAVSPEVSNPELAKKYYSLSEQPPAKWRLAKLYLSKQLRYDGNVNVIAYRLIYEAIQMLLKELINQRYFEIRLEYLLDMYRDLHGLTLDDKQQEKFTVYFEILRWIVNNQQNIRPNHQEIICQLIEFDVPFQSNSDKITLDEVTELLS